QAPSAAATTTATTIFVCVIDSPPRHTAPKWPARRARERPHRRPRLHASARTRPRSFVVRWFARARALERLRAAGADAVAPLVGRVLVTERRAHPRGVRVVPRAAADHVLVSVLRALRIDLIL